MTTAEAAPGPMPAVAASTLWWLQFAGRCSIDYSTVAGAESWWMRRRWLLLLVLVAAAAAAPDPGAVAAAATSRA